MGETNAIKAKEEAIEVIQKANSCIMKWFEEVSKSLRVVKQAFESDMIGDFKLEAEYINAQNFIANAEADFKKIQDNYTANIEPAVKSWVNTMKK